MSKKIRTESQEQQNLVLKLRWLYPDILFFSIPNGGKRAKSEARTIVLEGAEKGTPDLFIAEPKGNYHGLFIEMKRQDEKHSKISENQQEKLAKLLARKYRAEICYSAQEALQIIKVYLEK